MSIHPSSCAKSRTARIGKNSVTTHEKKANTKKINKLPPSDAQRPDATPILESKAISGLRDFTSYMSSAKQVEANRANALLSSGPTSSQGKAKVAHNALKTGLTGRTVLLPSDDVAAYQAHTERTFKLWSPEADEEKRLTQSLADTLWRLERVPSLEAGIYAIGRREFAAQFADEEDESVRKAMIEAQIFLSYRRDLNNLSVQEARLRRVYEKEEAELKRLIAERQQAGKDRQERENRRWSVAIENYKTAKHYDLPFDPAEIGFEFSTEEIAARHEKQHMEAVIRGARYYEYKSKGYIKTPEKKAA